MSLDRHETEYSEDPAHSLLHAAFTRGTMWVFPPVFSRHLSPLPLLNHNPTVPPPHPFDFALIEMLNRAPSLLDLKFDILTLYLLFYFAILSFFDIFSFINSLHTQIYQFLFTSKFISSSSHQIIIILAIRFPLVILRIYLSEDKKLETLCASDSKQIINLLHKRKNVESKKS